MTRKRDVVDLNNVVLLVAMLSFLLFACVVPAVFAYTVEYDFRWQMLYDSMIPTLQLFDFVYIKNVTGQAEVHASYIDGDIILFRVPSNPHEFMLHRAVEKFQQDSLWYFKTKGDHNEDIDDWNISENLVIGKAVGLSRLLQVDSYYVTVFSNSAFDNFHLNATINALEFTVTTLLTQSAPNSFLNVTIPAELVTGELDVRVDGSSVYFDYSDNVTHYFVWFDWEGSQYVSDIVLPEFPSLIVLPLFMIATSSTVIICRRKHTI